jgi:hypothetical protein
MNWQDAALGMAGVIGCCVAVFHGVLIQRLMVRFSTISWFLGSVALIAAANWFEEGARLSALGQKRTFARIKSMSAYN